MKEPSSPNMSKPMALFGLFFILFTYGISSYLYGLKAAGSMTIGASTLVTVMLLIYATHVKGKDKAAVREILTSGMRWITVMLCGNTIHLVSRIIKSMDYTQDVFFTLTLIGILISFKILATSNDGRTSKE